MNGSEGLLHDGICAHLYQSYQSGLFFDLVLKLHRNKTDLALFKLHRVVAVRSPLIANLLQETDQRYYTYC
jgi:hypothetical protein